MMPTLSGCTRRSILQLPRLPRPHKSSLGQRLAAPQVLLPVLKDPRGCAAHPAAATPAPPPSSYRLQPAQQNPLSELPISSWSFACFLTSGSRQAQAEISDMETQRNPHTLMGMRVGFGGGLTIEHRLRTQVCSRLFVW